MIWPICEAHFLSIPANYSSCLFEHVSAVTLYFQINNWTVHFNWTCAIKKGNPIGCKISKKHHAPSQEGQLFNCYGINVSKQIKMKCAFALKQLFRLPWTQQANVYANNYRTDKDIKVILLSRTTFYEFYEISSCCLCCVYAEKSVRIISL